MISSAETHANRANIAREAAEEKVEDLRLELDACRQLFSEEEALLQAEIDELKAAARSWPDAPEDSDVASLQHRVGALEQNNTILQDELCRARNDASELREELAAVRILAAEEDEALRETISHLMSQLKQAGAGTGGSDAVGDEINDDPAAARVAELEAQVSSLLQLQEDAVAELVTLRPKMAILEAKLVQLGGMQPDVN